METFVYIIPLFFLTALLYASVGFGGGSTYLALLVLFAFPYTSMPKAALICNLIVVTGGLYHYIRGGHFLPKRILPFIVTSIPLSFLGGSIPIDKKVFLILLGGALGVAGIRLLWSDNTLKVRREIPPKAVWSVGLVAGGGLGFLSGLVGIGGGIFLAPLLYFLRWGSGRQIAAMASFFIFVNSLFGLAGQFSKGGMMAGSEWILPLSAAVFLGGQIGSRISNGKISLAGLQRLTAVLILCVAARIFWGVF